MKNYINLVMRDKINTIPAKLLKPVLYAVSLAYFGCVKIWAALYERKILKSSKVSSRVLSVGNFTVGGTGKTPFTIFLAEGLIKKGKRVAVITRGYGEDEALMLKDRLPMATVLVGRDRVALARSVEGKADTVILDDGFQHRALSRDVNILLIDATNPLGNLYMFPRGILREPVTSIRNADIVVITKADLGRDNVAELRNWLSFRFNMKNVYEAVYRPVCFYRAIDGAKVGPETVKGRDVMILSGIADSSYFKYMVKELGGNLIKSFDFPDHHMYSMEDILTVDREVSGSGVLVITTQKDHVKLKHLNMPVVRKNLVILEIDISMNGKEEELIGKLS